MSCERYREALTDAAAGGPVPGGVEAHLASCEACRRELAALRQALALADAEMARLAAAEPSPGLPARIRHAVAESGSVPAWRFGWLWPVAAAAATLLVALAVWVGRAPSPQTRVAVGGTTGHPGGAAERVAPHDDTATPSAGPTERGGLGSAGASLGTSPVGVPREGRAVTSRHRWRPARAAPASPEVLVPRGEAEALVRFAALVHRDGHTPVAFLAAGRSSPDLAEPAALDITPLEIVPLDPAETPGT
ncbi:MAG TPA: hypothetical protein VLL75_12700 [Vicinamibacteria bacterium]|nr:hypothetical protein [Vicinamibacteria bacterium]